MRVAVAVASVAASFQLHCQHLELGDFPLLLLTHKIPIKRHYTDGREGSTGDEGAEDRRRKHPLNRFSCDTS